MKNHRICYYCGFKKLEDILRIDSTYTLVKCSKCYLAFTYPQEKIKVVKENDKKYNSEADEKGYLGIYEQIYKRAQKYVQTIRKYKASGNYLDIGCSYGVYLKAAKEAGFNTYGVEMAPNAADYAKKEFKLNVFIGTLEKAKYKSEIFDVITLYDVIEHIPNMKEFLKEVYRVLKPGGILVIQCPNIESYAFRVLDKDWNWLLVPQHVWHFSVCSLSNVLKDYKFSIVKITTWDSPYDFASNWVTKMGLTKQNPTVEQKLIRKFIYYLLYGGISLGTLVWSKSNKGGDILLYAIKK